MTFTVHKSLLSHPSTAGAVALGVGGHRRAVSFFVAWVLVFDSPALGSALAIRLTLPRPHEGRAHETRNSVVDVPATPVETIWRDDGRPPAPDAPMLI